MIAIENVRLFQTVERQRTELARFAPQAADLLSSNEGEQLLAAHRREITALFFDLRGFTAFAETAEPEEVFRILRRVPHGRRRGSSSRMAARSSTSRATG